MRSYTRHKENVQPHNLTSAVQFLQNFATGNVLLTLEVSGSASMFRDTDTEFGALFCSQPGGRDKYTNSL